MAFETGSSSSPSNLLTKLATFLVAAGWTKIRDTGGSSGKQLVVTDPTGGIETNVFSFEPFSDAGVTAHWKCQPALSAPTSGDEVYEHVGSPVTSGVAASYVKFGQSNAAAAQGFEDASTKYWFFADALTDGRYCHVVLEGEAERYWHLSFGTIVKSSDFSGGQYMTAVNLGTSTSHDNWAFDGKHNLSFSTGASWIRDDDNYTGTSFSSDSGTSYWSKYLSLAGTFSTEYQILLPLYAGGPQAWNMRSPFCPIWAQHWDVSDTPSFPSTNWKLLGQFPDIRFVSMTGRDPEEELVIGSDTWHIFPMHRKTTDAADDINSYRSKFTAGGAPNYSSNLMGLAYLEVP